MCSVSFFEGNWLWLILTAPIAVYAAWVSSMVIPQVVRVVLPEVVRAVVGG